MEGYILCLLCINHGQIQIGKGFINHKGPGCVGGFKDFLLGFVLCKPLSLKFPFDLTCLFTPDNVTNGSINLSGWINFSISFCKRKKKVN